MAQQTAMRQLKWFISDGLCKYDESITVSEIWNKLNCLLQIEKEQILDAHIEGQRVFDKHPHTQWTNDQAEHYYNETYNK